MAPAYEDEQTVYLFLKFETGGQCHKNFTTVIYDRSRISFVYLSVFTCLQRVDSRAYLSSLRP
jgi:hypothetical protein